MPSLLEATFAAEGYAKVIVSFKRGAAAVDFAAIQSDLEPHFITPNEGQFESLAAAETRRRPALALERVATQPPRLRIYPHLGLAIGFIDAQGARTVADDGRVDQVVEAPELSLIRPVTSRSARLTVEPTWGIRRLRVDKLWAAGFKGEGVIVGHLDTGVDGSHPALEGAIDEFAEFDLFGNRVAGAPATDSNDHGTHTAGTIVGRPTKGVFGVAPQAKVASGMVIEGGQVVDRILAGMEWVASKNVRILSMSLGLRGFTPAFQVIVDALRDANILPVIAVGNEFANTSRSPGNYANVLSIGAINGNDVVADFSSSQRFNREDDPLVPDIVAPGVNVLSCVPGGKFEKKDGTSMATPHVAGLAALLVQAKPNASAAELELAILGSCSRPLSMPEARANRGVPDAVDAFTRLTGTPPVATA